MVQVLPEPAGADLPTVRELLVRREATYANRSFLRFEDADYTYADLATASNRIANALLERGVRPGDRVAVWMHNRPEYLAVLFAAAKAGFVAVTLNPAVRSVDGRYLLDDCDARVVIYGPEVADRFAAIRMELASTPMEFMVADAAVPTGPPEFDDLYTASADLPPDPGIEPSTPASIIYTSGTTGLPKGVVLPHHAYVNTASWYGEHVVAADESDTFFTCLPLYHCNAQIFTTMTAIMRGSGVAMVKSFSASRFFDQVRHYKATIFNFIGMMLVAIFKQPRRVDDADNPARCGFGIPVPAGLGRQFEERFSVALLEGYGATETACGFLFNTVQERRLGWAGRALPYAEIRVVDDTGRVLQPGQVGRIQMRPRHPHLWMSEYHNKPEQTANAWRDGWLHLDDYGELDKDGWLAFRGRGLDWVRRRGENISAIEIEDTCDQHPDVAKSAVVAVPSELTEEEVKLVVEWRPGSEPDPDGLVRWLGERLAAYKLPAFVETVESIPRTATGKIAKYRLDRSPSGQWARPRPVEGLSRGGGL